MPQRRIPDPDDSTTLARLPAARLGWADLKKRCLQFLLRETRRLVASRPARPFVFAQVTRCRTQVEEDACGIHKLYKETPASVL